MSDPKNSPIFECSFCGSIFTKNYNLRSHQKSAKYCLALQGIKIESKYKCKYCNYETNRKSDYQRHNSNCKEKKEYELKTIDNLERKISIQENTIDIMKNYEKEFKREAFKPKNITNNNNVTFNMQIENSKNVLSPYSMLQKLFEMIITSNFTTLHFRRGIQGVLAVVNNKILQYDDKKWLISYDNSKTTFHKKNEDKIQIDERAEYFLNEIYPIFEKMARTYRSDLIMETEDNKEEDEISEAYFSIKRIGDRGSKEREQCINNISRCNYISNRDIKLKALE